MGTKGGQLCILAPGPKLVTEHLETGGVWGGGLVLLGFCRCGALGFAFHFLNLIFLFPQLCYLLQTGGGARMGLKFPLEHDVNMLACLLLLRCHPTDNKSCCVLPT